MRSFLFVPGDSVRKFESAKKTAADALILDLEDSIAPEGKVAARGIVRQMLDARNPVQKMYIRVNALDTGMTLGDLADVVPGRPDGIVLPKCAGAADVNKLALYLDAFEVAAGIEQGTTRIVTVATETARAPAAPMPDATSVSFSGRVEDTATSNPSRASASAIAAPMPCEAPVTKAVRRPTIRGARRAVRAWPRARPEGGNLDAAEPFPRQDARTRIHVVDLGSRSPAGAF